MAQDKLSRLTQTALNAVIANRIQVVTLGKEHLRLFSEHSAQGVPEICRRLRLAAAEVGKLPLGVAVSAGGDIEAGRVFVVAVLRATGHEFARIRMKKA